jgi:hypothetical protein
MASDLTKEEQDNVRSALRFLVTRSGDRRAIAKALRVHADTISRMTRAGIAIGPSVAIRVARMAQAGIDDVLAGRWPVPGTCPHCGRGPS